MRRPEEILLTCECTLTKASAETQEMKVLLTWPSHFFEVAFKTHQPAYCEKLFVLNGKLTRVASSSGNNNSHRTCICVCVCVHMC